MQLLLYALRDVQNQAECRIRVDASLCMYEQLLFAWLHPQMQACSLGGRVLARSGPRCTVSVVHGVVDKCHFMYLPLISTLRHSACRRKARDRRSTSEPCPGSTYPVKFVCMDPMATWHPHVRSPVQAGGQNAHINVDYGIHRVCYRQIE